MRGWNWTPHPSDFPHESSSSSQAPRQATWETPSPFHVILSIFQQGKLSAEHPGPGFSTSKSKTFKEKGRQKKTISPTAPLLSGLGCTS